MKLLITAFDPFGGSEENASLELLRALPETLEGAEIVKLVLPTVFRRSGEKAIQRAEEVRPDAIVCMGQAGGRRAITPERVGLNLMDARIPDNDGFQPVDEPILPGGPAAYFSTLPIKPMAAAIRAAGVPAEISNTAGTFVCNSLFYQMRHYTETRCPEVPCGFIHVPLLKDLPLPDGLRGLKAALGMIAKYLQKRNERA